MRKRYRYYAALSSGGLILALLIGLTIITPPTSADLLPALLFCFLVVFTLIFGLPLSEGAISLMPMTILAAYLVVGLVPAGWVAFVSSIIHGWIRDRWIDRSPERRVPGSLEPLARTAVNAAMHTASILAGGAIYQLLGGSTPLRSVDVPTLFRFSSLGLTLLSVNFLIAGLFIAARGMDALRSYIGSLRRIVLVEGGTLVFSLLVAVTYSQLGRGYFVLLGLNLVLGSLVARNTDAANRQLARRVRELDSLQAVGQALSASLDIDALVLSIYEQVSRLMPAHEFFVAMYDSEIDEVSFPLAMQGGQRVVRQPRRAGNSLTEYVLKTKSPLLIRSDVERKLNELGLDDTGREVKCWLGVPMLAGSEPLGVLAVQSSIISEAYTASHQRVLVTIAAQAATAIQNARRYIRTDEALTRRVQELGSILRTTRDGFLLLDTDHSVLTINRTLTDWVDIAHADAEGQAFDAALATGESLSRLLGYTANVFHADCQALATRETNRKRAIVLLGPSMRHVERTLIPVRDQDETITGWLLAFRDMTEEMELARLRDDMTEMLVHDLRSPLTAVIGSLALLKHFFDTRDAEGFERMQSMAEQNADRILHIVNQLLDIGRLESGQLHLERQDLDIKAMFDDTMARYAPLASEARIELASEIGANLPDVYADLSLISRVLDNLLDNAIKFTPDGGQVKLWTGHDPAPDPTEIVLGVSDTGPGIPEEVQPRLFEKFLQVGSLEGRRSGTGLGLAFCKLAVEAHGGRIWVESKVGQGSAFIFALPLAHQQKTDLIP